MAATDLGAGQPEIRRSGYAPAWRAVRGRIFKVPSSPISAQAAQPPECLPSCPAIEECRVGARLPRGRTIPEGGPGVPPAGASMAGRQLSSEQNASAATAQLDWSLQMTSALAPRAGESGDPHRRSRALTRTRLRAPHRGPGARSDVEKDALRHFRSKEI